MSATINRRDWLRNNSLAAIGLGIGFRSMANEEGITRSFGAPEGLINLGSNENPLWDLSQSKRSHSGHAFRIAPLSIQCAIATEFQRCDRKIL